MLCRHFGAWQDDRSNANDNNNYNNNNNNNSNSRNCSDNKRNSLRLQDRVVEFGAGF